MREASRRVGTEACAILARKMLLFGRHKLKRMRNFTIIRSAFALICCAVVVAGCDKEEVKPGNHITILGTKYKINHAVLHFHREVDLIQTDNQEINTHYGYTLYISDGTIDMNGGAKATNASYLANLSFYTTIVDHDIHFPAGTFDAVSFQDLCTSKSPTDKSFFSAFFIQ